MITLQRTIPGMLTGVVASAVRNNYPSLAAVIPPSATGVIQSKRGMPGDYQTSAAMAIARQAKLAPEKVAVELCDSIKAASAEVGYEVATSSSKNGFVNMTLPDEWLIGEVHSIAEKGLNHPVRHAVDLSSSSPAGQRVLVDYGSPNMGKELHPGHLRSAVIGDSLARGLAAAGWSVDRVSHVGDAGLPVAIVLAWYLQQHNPAWLGPDVSLASIRSGDVPLPSPRQLSQAYEQGKRLMTLAAAAAKADNGSAVSAAVDNDPTESLTSADSAAQSPASISHSPEEIERARAFTAFVQATLRELQAVLARLPELQALEQAGNNSNDTAAQLPALYRTWVAVCEASRRGYLPLFSALSVSNIERGESTYVHLLEGLVNELLTSGVAEVSNGAVVLFVDGRDKPPLLLRKADGGYLYATIDMAALRSRLQAGYDRLVYVTDAAQSHHFRQLFAAARYVGWVSPSGGNMLRRDAPGAPVLLQHASFGVVLGAGGRKLSSREGAEATLAGLLEEARATVAHTAGERQQQQLQQKGSGDGGEASQRQPPPPPLSPSSIAAIAHSAVRYFDLSHAAGSSYRLSFEAALSLRGNTAPYLMYALTRLGAIRRQAARALELEWDSKSSPSYRVNSDSEGDNGSAVAASIDDAGPPWAACIAAVEARAAQLQDNLTTSASSFSHPCERVLALSILRLPEALAGSLTALSPHVLAEHMAATAADFHSFYEACKVVQLPASQPSPDAAAADVELLRRSAFRLRLCAATDHALRVGCHVLGVQTVQRM